MKKYLILLLFLSGCANTEIKEVLIEVPKPVYPEQNNLDIPQLELKSPVWELPRDSEGEIIDGSNIYLGLNEENFILYRENLMAQKEHARRLTNRIIEANKVFTFWRKRAEKGS